MTSRLPRTLLFYSAPSQASGDAWMDFLPIGLGYLQALLKAKGYPCRLANLSGKRRKDVVAYLREQAPDVIGASCFTFNRRRTFELLAWAREACPSALLLAGGPHPSHLAQDVFEACPALDAIVKGEGEGPLLAVVECLAHAESAGEWRDVPGLILRNGETAAQPPVADLDTLPLPVEHIETDFLDDPNQHAFLCTSRGCPATCGFCNTPAFWGTAMRFRSPDSVMKELRLLRERYGLTYFSFRDDTFTARKRRILDLMALIQSSGLHPLWNCQSRVNLVDEERLVAMKRAGCEFIQFGIEHASPPMLLQLAKDLNLDRAREALRLTRKVGIGLGIYLITGIPGERAEDVEASAQFIRETKPQDVQVSPLAVYPGTKVWDRLLAEGRLDQDFFRRTEDSEVFARVDSHTKRALERLEQEAARMKIKALYTHREFAEQKRWLGFCAVTNLLCGEAAEQASRFTEAESEYAEIINREPANVWGFLKRGLLRNRLGRSREARMDILEVLRLAPGNPEASEWLAHQAHQARR